MSTVPDKIQEIAADGVADGLHIVSEEALAAEQVVRSIDKLQIGYIGLGVAIGAATGALIAFKVAYLRAETKYAKITEDEISDMREHYQDKVLALEATAQKEDLEEIVAERGYKIPEGPSEKPPMAVSPPQGIVDAAQADPGAKPVSDRLKPNVPTQEPEVRNVFADHGNTVADETEQSADASAWNYHEEQRRRSPDHPYVIHYDEREEFEGYNEVTLTYYEADDVLCNERDEIVDPVDREKLIGEMNLEKFGHGSNDPLVVYIRNDKLELVYEVVKSPNSYAEEVHGLKHMGYGGNLERMRARERDEQEDG